MTCECFSIKSINWDKNDKRERVLWLHDVYHHPIYNADEGKNFIKIESAGQYYLILA